ncbi:molecular chaperone DnaJ [Thauera propionica]|jgi:molecular chaperone DnaJ|uniref:Molecular chaperone DnaJ n=1 Tax=Thauera propionica TaxID=2019431 RepID=A0A235EVS7_9RHOO|nr:DnaJ C-terminal domain-containing protein [Thauera propionica]OYD53152.1 molecular chaperone DnaJ [Thauera propionica]
MHDAYELLGLKPGVTRAEIRRAFRRLAMHWHPDRNTDPIAPEHFRALRQAHDRLLDGIDENLTDAVHTSGADKTTTPDAAEANAAHTATDAEPRGADRFMDLELTFEEAIRGGQKPLCLEQSSTCPHCDGAGEVALALTRLCEPCRGSGRVGSSKNLQRCKVCDGRGYRTTAPCPHCDGQGQTTRERWLAIGLPPGLIDGDSLRLAGEGEPHPEHSDRPGDLQLRIRLQPHALFRRRGRDLVVQRPVSAVRLLLGGELRVPHPAGARTLELAPGNADPREARIRGAGFPARGERHAGDLIVELRPIMVSHADDELQPLLEALEQALQRALARHLPELATWEDKWLPD